MLRARCILGLAIFSLLGLLAGQAMGQVAIMPKKGPPPPPVGGGSASGHSSVKIVEDSNLRRFINVGRDCIKDKDWKQAVEALQPILNKDQDFYVQVHETDEAGKPISRWTSVKFEANNLLGQMDLDGLNAYEQLHGADAKTALDEAKNTGDMTLLARTAQRFCHTKAGIEANEILATLYMARGQVFTAALRYEKILQMNPERTRLSDMTLYKAAYAFQRAGDKKNKEVVWDRLLASLKSKGAPGLKLGEEMIPVANLEKVLLQSDGAVIVNVHDWPSWRGNIRNSAQASGSPPLLDTKIWSRPVFMDVLDGFPDQDPDQAAQARVNAAVKQVSDANQAVLPGFYPIASQGVMVYRSQRDIRAVALKEIEIKDEESGLSTKIKPGQLLWKSIPMNRSLALLLEKNHTKAHVDKWLDGAGQMQGFNAVPGFSRFLYENSLIGTMVTDHRLVYAINDMAVPPHPGVFMQMQFNPNFNQMNPGDIKPMLMQNELYAYDLITGKLKWDLNHDDPEFKDSHFLSLPISIGGKLYVLNERLINPNENAVNPFGGGITNPIGGESELRLVCIDPTKLRQVNSNIKPTILEPIQILGNVAIYNRHVQDIGRRTSAVQLAYDEGVLVCPTNAGEVFGIDLMTKSLVWSYPYRENAHQQILLPGMNPNMGFPGPKPGTTTTTIYSKWKSSPPAIQDGKIVFTAPDADSVHCINLRDGKPIWKRGQKKGDLYMAGVYQGRVLVVSETDIRALDLKTGGQMWSIGTGDLPSGQGVASKGIYYLPLKKGEILAVDIVKGEIKAHNRAANIGAAPGNLVFYENMVLSQTVTEVAAYPQLSARLDSAKIDSANDPDNLAKMTEYGDLLLKDGQVQLAVTTLHKVYDRKPAEPLSARVNARLFEALTDLMQIDFAKADKDYLDTYKALCLVPNNNAEEQHRKAKFFRLVGQGREAQGNLVEAFQMYKDFGALPIYRDVGIPSTEDPNQKIPINVWLRGRISGMLAKATEAQKAPLEAKIAAEWKEVEAKKDIDAIRSFVGMFDIPVRVGREARVKLAETIMDRNEKANFLEAEMFLHQVLGSEFRADPKTGGRALAALAQLEELKGTMDSMRLAAAYYRELGKEFAKEPVRGNKTGADLLSALATDKRYLPFLEETTGGFGPVKIAAREIGAGQINIGIPGFHLMPLGDQTPFAKSNKLILELNNAKFAGQPGMRFFNTATGQDRWDLNLGQVPMNAQLYHHLYQQANVNQGYYPNARFRFYNVKGHLIVCQVGVMVYAIDGDSGKKLWEVQTVENIPQNGQVFLNQVINDQGDGTPIFIYHNNLTGQRTTVELGRIGTAQASYVAVLTHKGLTVRDPLRGTQMWKRDDVSIHSHVFGDEQYLFLAEANSSARFVAGRTIRANDGELVAVPDFGTIYETRIHPPKGAQILAAQVGQGNLTVHLYDILKGKDLWAKQFPAGSSVLHTEDPSITGVIDPAGKLTVMESDTGKVLLESNVVQGRITQADVKGLHNPLLLQDSERFYVALNHPIEGAKVAAGKLHSNISSGTRCLPVNGWFLALQRQPGSKKVGDKELTWQKGDLAWHSYMPVTNQMIILDQFEQSPIVQFTVRYNEIMPNGGNRWVSVTQSLHKSSGKMLYDPGPKNTNGAAPYFALFQMDMKSRTINLMGYSGSVQHYVDDGKAPPNPMGAMLEPQGVPGGIDKQAIVEQRLQNPALRIRFANDVQVLPVVPLEKREKGDNK